MGCVMDGELFEGRTTEDESGDVDDALWRRERSVGVVLLSGVDCVCSSFGVDESDGVINVCGDGDG